MGNGLAKTASSFCGLEQDKSTTGAQELPFGIVVVSNETISQELSSSRVFYIGGPLDNQFVGFRRR